jgi:S-adenosylmethionine synthetase
MKDYLFTSESVTEGHPDKMADQISDALLDRLLEKDKHSKVACQTLISNGFCVIAGELHTQAYVPMQDVAREVIRYIGYTDSAFGFDYRTAGLLNSIGETSPDIAMNESCNDMYACDQGVVTGYACNESKNYMPMAIEYAHTITKSLATVRKDCTLPFLRPDGKAQVTVSYKDKKPHKIEKIVVSSQHSPDVSLDVLRDSIIEEVIKKNIPKELLSDNIEYLINSSGQFTIGGPRSNAGLTGRKVAVDTYGGYAPHSGGSFSGKDPSNIDRCGAYMARYIAKNLVASGACDKVIIQIAYAIGKKEPVSLMIDTQNSANVDENMIHKCVVELFDLRPKAIIEKLDLLRPIYQLTSCYGHFGRVENSFTWEKLDMVEQIKAYLKV